MNVFKKIWSPSNHAGLPAVLPEIEGVVDSGKVNILSRLASATLNLGLNAVESVANGVGSLANAGAGVVFDATFSHFLSPSDEQEIENVIEDEPEVNVESEIKEEGKIVRIASRVLNFGVGVAEKFGAGLSATAGFGVDVGLFGFNYVESTLNKIKGREEEHLVDSEKGVQYQLNRLNNHDFHSQKSMIELTDFFTNIALKCLPENGIFGFVLECAGKDHIGNTIKANLLSILLNVMEKSTIENQSEADTVDENNLGISELFGVQSLNPARCLQSALKNIFKPFAEEYSIKEKQIEDAQYEVEKAQAKVTSFDSVKTIQADLLRKQSITILARRDILEKLKNADRETILREKEIKESLKAGVAEKLVEIRQSATLSKEKKAADIRDAKDALNLCSSEIEALDALLGGETEKLKEFGKAADLIQIQLETLSVLEMNDAGKLEEAKAQAVSNGENALKALNESIEARKNFVCGRIAPQYLKTFFPEDEYSLLLYQKYLPFTPLQDQFGPYIWSFVKTQFAVYFEQIMPLLLLLDKPAQEAILDKNPHAPLIREGIDLLSKDVFKLVLDLLKITEPLSTNFEEFLSPYFHYLAMKIVNHDKINRDTILHIIELLTNLKPSFPSKSDLENPVEPIKEELKLLFPEAGIDIEQAYSFYLEERKLTNVKDGELKTALRRDLKQFHEKRNLNSSQAVIKEVFKLLDLENFETFGLPLLAGKPLQSLAEKELSKLLNTWLLRPEIDLKRMKFVHLENDAIGGTALKVDTLKKAFPAIIYTQLDKNLDTKVKTGNGFSKIVNLISKLLGTETKKMGKDFPFLDFLSGFISDGHFDQLIEDGLEFIGSDENAVKVARTEVVQMLNPFLVNMAVKALTPVLEKEKNGGALFDQSLLVSVLPFLSDHFKKLNNSSSSSPLKEGVEVSAISQQAFYREASTKLIAFFFPKNAESLKELFPGLTDKELAKSWNLITTELPSFLSKLKDMIFDKSLLTDILIELYKTCIETFTATAVKKAGTTDTVPPALSPAEIAMQSKMEKELKEVIYQAARLTDLPVDRMLKIASYIPGNRKILDIIIKSIAKAIAKEFNGKLIVNAIDKGLKSQINKVKSEASQASHVPKDKSAELDRLEKQFVESMFSFGLRTINEKIESALSKLDYPVIKQIKNVIYGFLKFFISKVVVGIFKFFGLGTKTVDKTFQILHRNRVNLQTGFAQPKKHEAALLEMIQAGTNVLESEWSPKAYRYSR